MTIHYIRRGCLHRDNGKDARATKCPYQPSETCGDWCALFHETEGYVTLHCAGVRVQVEREGGE